MIHMAVHSYFFDCEQKNNKLYKQILTGDDLTTSDNCNKAITECDKKIFLPKEPESLLAKFSTNIKLLPTRPRYTIKIS